VCNRLERYASAIGRKLLMRYNLVQDHILHEDTTHSLLLAGWEVWRDTGDEALARHRMSRWAPNDNSKLYSALEQPPVHQGVQARPSG
jgi:hypothetical protein